MLTLLRAAEHAYGPGKVHAFVYSEDGNGTDGKTRCGKTRDRCPGEVEAGAEDDITCKGCRDGLIVDRQRAQREAEWRREQAERQAEREERSRLWWVQYQDHLSSPGWRRRRDLVMRRAGTICEGCGEVPATAVHHVTYDSYNRLGREFLWELAAVCDDCHADIHPHLR
jgi:5-methylcytosine-specific restriction endonuclease McrA